MQGNVSHSLFGSKLIVKGLLRNNKLNGRRVSFTKLEPEFSELYFLFDVRLLNSCNYLNILLEVQRGRGVYINVQENSGYGHKSACIFVGI